MVHFFPPIEIEFSNEFIGEKYISLNLVLINSIKTNVPAVYEKKYSPHEYIARSSWGPLTN